MQSPLLLYLSWNYRYFRYYELLLEQGKYQEVLNRVCKLYKWLLRQATPDLVSIAFNNLYFGRAYLFKAQMEGTYDFAKAIEYLNHSVDGLRQAGTQHELPRGLLARAELRRICRDYKHAQQDLDEAMTIATRGRMRLHEADCHLEYARLYLAMGEKEKARESLDTAKKMIEEMEYHRRDPEVLSATAHLHILEGKNDDARQTLAAARTLIDEMGCHRWDMEVEALEERLKV